ncbi:DEAD/DEAH box helicase family protein, partial [Candidatus Woesearchaeota archaeon]|nr:DEAD/DEAH box helicase family protein [Candidatus Woesearchaeota archaeon]
MDIQFNPDGSLKMPAGVRGQGQSGQAAEKKHNCNSCGRPIRHRGFCLTCNMKKQEARDDTTTSQNKSSHIKSSFALPSPKSISVFPYSAIRDSQREMMGDVKAAVGSRRHLIADAPTGIGKTIAALYPALEYAVRNNKTVFFLTSRVSQHRAAIDTLKLMKQKGNSFNAVDIVGKMHLCSHDVEGMTGSMFYDFCDAMVQDKKCDYYNNYESGDTGVAEERASLRAAIHSKGPLNTQEAMSMMSARFCTYEMLMDAASSADVIIGDYFHLFGRGGRFLKRMGKELKDVIIIADEAHNLSARLRDYMSSKL